MTKKSTKRTKQQQVSPAAGCDEATALLTETTVAAEPVVPTATPEEAKEAPAPQPSPWRLAKKQAKTKRSKGATKPPTKQPRAERESVLDLEPADEIKPVRAGTHLADVLELTARAEGATAVELDKAIVSTAKSVKHYGLWALRYPLHKDKGYGFRTVLKDGKPARYHLVLPEGEKLESFLVAPSGREQSPPTPKPARRSAKKATKRQGKKLAAVRA